MSTDARIQVFSSALPAKVKLHLIPVQHSSVLSMSLCVLYRWSTCILVQTYAFLVLVSKLLLFSLFENVLIRKENLCVFLSFFFFNCLLESFLSAPR